MNVYVCIQTYMLFQAFFPVWWDSFSKHHMIRALKMRRNRSVFCVKHTIGSMARACSNRRIGSTKCGRDETIDCCVCNSVNILIAGTRSIVDHSGLKHWVENITLSRRSFDFFFVSNFIFLLSISVLFISTEFFILCEQFISQDFDCFGNKSA